MPLSFSTTADAQHQRVSILIYGEGGIGKTSLVHTLPVEDPAAVLYVAADPGQLALRSRPYTMVRAEGGAWTRRELFDLYEHIRGSGSRYAWVVIDGLDEIGKSVLRAMLKGEKEPRRAYGNMAETMELWTKQMRDLPNVSVLFITHLAEQVVEAGDRVSYYPVFPGKVVTGQLVDWFDLVGCMRAVRSQNERGAEQVERMIQWRPEADPRYRVKDRAGVTEPLGAPDLGALITRLRAEGLETSAPAAEGSGAEAPPAAATPPEAGGRAQALQAWEQGWNRASKAKPTLKGRQAAIIGAKGAELMIRRSRGGGWSRESMELVLAEEIGLARIEDIPVGIAEAVERIFSTVDHDTAMRNFPPEDAEPGDPADGQDPASGYDPAEEAGDGPEESETPSVPAEALAPPGAPTVAEILEPLAELPGDSAGPGSAWERITKAMAQLQGHHPDQCKPVFGDHKIAIYKAAQEAHGLGTGDAETYVAECLGAEAFAELPDVLSAAVVEVLTAFPTKGGGGQAPAPQAQPAAGQVAASIPAGWRTFGVSQLATVARALIAQGQIAEEDVPQGSGRAVKEQLIKAIERAVAEHGIGEEG